MKHNEKGWNLFLRLCHNTKSLQELHNLFDFLFTLDEQEQIANRVLLSQALLQYNKSQRQISTDLNVSIAKITRGSNALKTIDPKLKQFLLQELG